MQNEFITITLSESINDEEHSLLSNLGCISSSSKMISGDTIYQLIIIASPLVIKFAKDIIIAKINEKKVKSLKYNGKSFTGFDAKEIKEILSIIEKIEEKDKK